MGLRLPMRVAAAGGAVVLAAVGLAEARTSAHPWSAALTIAMGAGFLSLVGAFAGVSRPEGHLRGTHARAGPAGRHRGGRHRGRRALTAGARGFLTEDAGADEIRAAITTVAAGEAQLDPSVQRRLLEALAPDGRSGWQELGRDRGGGGPRRRRTA